MPIVGAFMVPHPPIILPEIGRGEENVIARTIGAYRQAMQEAAALQPDTVIISSPHAEGYSDYFCVSGGNAGSGNFAEFGAPQVEISYPYDTELVKSICNIAAEEDFPAGILGSGNAQLDHGTMIPLNFLRQFLSDFKLVRVGLSGLPLEDHFTFGRIIDQAVQSTGRRAVFIASGDLSHRYNATSHYGYSPSGPEYDEKIMDVMGQGNFEQLLSFPEKFLREAAECGHRSFCIMAGALEGSSVESRALSHEGPWGVGYGVCTYKVQQPDPYVQLARMTVESFVRERTVPSVPEDLPEEMLHNRAGAFVSLHEHGELRGCIGTIGPTESCIAREIIQNAISAATRDPRFPPVTPDELEDLEISVDILGEPEPIVSESELDVKKYGVIVRSGYRCGLLLPNLEGVTSVKQQISIAKQKAGICPRQKYSMERFEVVRHV